MDALLTFILTLLWWQPMLPQPDPLWRDKGKPSAKPAYFVLPGDGPRTWKAGAQGVWREGRKLTVTRVGPGWIEVRPKFTADVYYLHPTAGWSEGGAFPNRATLRIEEIVKGVTNARGVELESFRVRARILALPPEKR